MDNALISVKVVPVILPAPAGSEYLAVVEWRDSRSDEAKRFPLHNPSIELYPGMMGFIFEARIIYVGPLTSFPNEFTIRKVLQGMKHGMKAWFVYCVIPYPDQERPFRMFPMEIADIEHYIAISQVPEYFYRPSLINEAMSYAWDRVG